MSKRWSLPPPTHHVLSLLLPPPLTILPSPPPQHRPHLHITPLHLRRLVYNQWCHYWSLSHTNVVCRRYNYWLDLNVSVLYNPVWLHFHDNCCHDPEPGTNCSVASSHDAEFTTTWSCGQTHNNVLTPTRCCAMCTDCIYNHPLTLLCIVYWKINHISMYVYFTHLYCLYKVCGCVGAQLKHCSLCVVYVCTHILYCSACVGSYAASCDEESCLLAWHCIQNVLCVTIALLMVHVLIRYS